MYIIKLCHRYENGIKISKNINYVAVADCWFTSCEHHGYLIRKSSWADLFSAQKNWVWSSAKPSNSNWLKCAHVCAQTHQLLWRKRMLDFMFTILHSVDCINRFNYAKINQRPNQMAWIQYVVCAENMMAENVRLLLFIVVINTNSMGSACIIVRLQFVATRVVSFVAFDLAENCYAKAIMSN